MNHYEENLANSNQTWGEGVSTFDRAKKTAADKLYQAAQALHSKSESTGTESSSQGLRPELGRYGHRAADMLERTADYVSEANPQQIKADLEQHVQRNPGRTILIAGGIGLLLGAIFRRR